MKPLPLLFALCLLFVACAVDRPPTGGPKDTAPLEILSVDPPPSSVNTSPQKILFIFNRYVPAWSLRKALVFSPAVTDYNLKADGKEAEILFTQPLDSNKTYTITLNTSLRSSRGNELVQSYTYAFSTGDKINRGIIGGQVFSNDNRPAPHALVLAYAVTNDTLSFNPLERKPDYSVQTGKNGKFTLEYLAEGSYRLLALQDRNGDQRLSPESEFFGVGQRKLVKTGSLDNLFRLAEPRLDPLPVYCSTPADNLLEITFNRSIPVDEFDITSLAVTDTLSNASVPIKGYYSLKNTREAVTFGVVSGKLDKKSGYRITYKGHTAP
ncbi:MAG: Ig-like domain-containing protein, partial [Chlorobiales bacterium]|nr:Ig-like domain-containing protein [Chlorobiales bacterium]